MDIGSLSQAAYLEILKRLQGSGYSNDPDSERYKELNAIAKIAEMASAAVGTASENLFISSASAALDLMERLRFLIQDGRTDESRRNRLLALSRSSKLVHDRLRNAFEQYTGATNGTTIVPDLDDARAHQASPHAALVVARKEPLAGDQQKIRDLTPVIERGVPATGIAGSVYYADMLYNASLDDGRAIGRTPLVTIPTQTKSRVAPIDVYPGCAFERAQWIEMQSMLIWKSRGFSIDQGLQGRFVFCTLTLGAGSSSLVDGPTHNGSVNWGSRFIQAWGTVAATSSADPTTRSDAEHVWLAASKTGPAGVGYTQTLVGTEGTTSGVTLAVDASGNLVVANTHGSTRYVTLMIRSTPKYSDGTLSDTQPWIDADTIVHDDLEDIHASTVITDDGPGSFGGGDAGALRRVIYTGPLHYETANESNRVLLDSSEDWRNRYVLVMPVHYATGFRPGGDETEAFFPSVEGLINLNRNNGTNSRPRIFYTGAGVAPGQDTPQPYQHPDASTDSQIWLFSDTDGNLWAEMKEDPTTGSTSMRAFMLALLIATERDDGSSVVQTVPVHATFLQTIDLEQPQNCGVYAQGQQGNVPRYTLADPAPRSLPTNPPLGLIAEGPMPQRAVQWMVRERLGATDDGSYLSRQKIFGQRKRIVSVQLFPSSETPVDDFNRASELTPGINDQLDFRDRFLWVEGRYSTNDITVSAAAPSSDTSETRFSVLAYLGPSYDWTMSIGSSLSIKFEFSRDGAGRGLHSRLLIVNGNGSNYYINAAIEVSGQLGLTDLRAYGQ